MTGSTYLTKNVKFKQYGGVCSMVGWLVVFGDSWVKQPNFMVELIMLQHSDYNRFSRSILKIIEGW